MSAARFKPGDRVRVKALYPPGHVRTPAYVRGKTGWVERVQGEFRNPETLAYGGDGQPRRPLYLVGFDPAHVWQRQTPLSSPRDRLYVDVYEPWLEAADEA